MNNSSLSASTHHQPSITRYETQTDVNPEQRTTEPIQFTIPYTNEKSIHLLTPGCDMERGPSRLFKALLALQEVSEIKTLSKHQEQTIFSTQFLAGSLTDAQKSRCMEDRREEGGGGGFF